VTSSPERDHSRGGPYVGPRPFGKGDPLPARRREVRELRDLLISERLVLLHSPSGAGKSSLIEASNGLRAALREEEFLLRPTIRVNQPAPAGVAANRYVLSVLRSLEEDRPEAERLSLSRLGELSFAEYLDERRVDILEDEGTSTAGHAAREVLVFDQFEEILTADPTDTTGRIECFRQLAAALTARHRFGLFVIREDHLGALEPWFRRLPTHMAHRYRLDLLGPRAAREAIVQPAAARGVTFADEAVTRLVDDLRRVLVQNVEGKLEPQLGPWVEPVQLQVVCFRLWEQGAGTDGTIALPEVELLGDVDVALGAYYADKLAAVEQRSGVSQRRLRAWVGSELLSPQGYRTQVMRGESSTEGLENRALDALEDAHLVRAQQRQGQRWYELAHDRLAEPVRRDNDRWEQEHLHAMQRQAVLWARAGRPVSMLLPEPALVDAEAWAKAMPDALEEPDRSFLAASRQALEGGRALQRAKDDAQKAGQELAKAHALAVVRRRATIFISAVALVAMIAGLVSFWQYRQAERARDEAEARKREAEIATSEAEARKREVEAAMIQAQDHARVVLAEQAAGDPTLQAALLREVERPAATHGWLQATVASAQRPKAVTWLRGHAQAVVTASFSADESRVVTASLDGTARVWRADGLGAPVVLGGHEDRVVSASFSADGSRVVTASADRTARVWRADGSGAPVVLRGHTAPVTWASFSPDGKRVATASLDTTVRLWSVDDGKQLGLLSKHVKPVVRAVFSADGSRVVTASWDGTARVWWLDGSREPIQLRGHDEPVVWAAFSPDGKRVVTASWDDTARVWGLDGSRPPVVLSGHTDCVASASFSPDGTRVVTASWDDTARVWPADGSGEPVVLRGHDDYVASAAFSPDGQLVVTSARDGTARVWSADGTGEPRVLRGHQDSVVSASFSAKGHWVVTASRDGTARVWSARAREEALVLGAHEGMVVSASFSADGKRVVTASEDRTARVWAADGSGAPVVLRGHEGGVVSASFSADGKRVVTASADRTARVWAADGTGAPAVLRGHEDAVRSASFSADGKRVVTASADRTARVWAADGSAEPVVLGGHEAALTSAWFSVDGKRVVTSSTDKTARVWAADGSGTPVVLRGHEGGVISASFSTDDRRIVTASLDHTARVWQADGTGTPVVLRGHEGGVVSALLSTDGTHVVTASADTTARVWPADGAGAPVVLRGHEGGVVWAAFSSDGRRVITITEGDTVRVWPADGSEEPIVVGAHDGVSSSGALRETPAKPGTAAHWSSDGRDEPLEWLGPHGPAAFSPDGTRLVTASPIVRAWPLDVPEWHDPLWGATTYCLSVDERSELLGEQPDDAAARRSSCMQTVAEYAAKDAYEPGGSSSTKTSG